MKAAKIFLTIDDTPVTAGATWVAWSTDSVTVLCNACARHFSGGYNRGTGENAPQLCMFQNLNRSDCKRYTMLESLTWRTRPRVPRSHSCERVAPCRSKGVETSLDTARKSACATQKKLNRAAADSAYQTAMGLNSQQLEKGACHSERGFRKQPCLL
jgi:hypothetical protein